LNAVQHSAEFKPVTSTHLCLQVQHRGALHWRFAQFLGRFFESANPGPQANSAGGQIIYGIEERDRKPVKVDQGSDITREWIEQVITSRVMARTAALACP
jgi:hypothetical protein